MNLIKWELFHAMMTMMPINRGTFNGYRIAEIAYDLNRDRLYLSLDLPKTIDKDGRVYRESPPYFENVDEAKAHAESKLRLFLLAAQSK